MNIRPRADWQSPSQPVVGPASNLSKIELIPAHYTAASTVPSDTASYLRSIQNDYTVNRGYSIGYNFAIDQAGVAWECRGLDIKCAANKDMNEVTIAILCLVDGAEAMNPAMVATFTALGAHIQDAVGRDLFVVGHRDIGSTACPGDGIYAQVQAGVLEPDDNPSQPPTPSPEDDMATCILHVDGRNLQLIGSGSRNPVDGSVHCVMVTWLGPGGSQFVEDHNADPAVVHQGIHPDILKRDIVLIGDPATFDDGAYRWGDADFYRVVK